MTRQLAFFAMVVAAFAMDAPAQTSAGGAPMANASQVSDVPSDRELTLVIHTAENCPICKVWRESASGLQVAKQLPQRWPNLQVVLVERKSLYGSESESLYPAQLQHLYQARKERYQLSPPVPLFEIVRGAQVVARQGGLQGWAEGILPALERLEANPANTNPHSQSSPAQ